MMKVALTSHTSWLPDMAFMTTNKSTRTPSDFSHTQKLRGQDTFRGEDVLFLLQKFE